MSQNDNVAHALSGAGGGALAMVVTYPLITLSTRAQTESRKEKTGKKVSAVDAAKAIVQREGISGLYAGLDSALFGITITNFIYYYFYEGTKNLYEAPAGQLTTLQSMSAGAIAGAATCIFTNPIWVVNTRMTVRDGSAQPSTLATVKDIYERDGLKAFFSGLGPALVLVINPVLQYTIFEQLRNAVEKNRKMTSIDAFFIGALGKIIATSVTYPYITLKARLQLRRKDNTASSSLIQGIKDIVARDGLAGLYGGLTTKVLQSALTSAFLFFFKEQLYAIAIAILAILRRTK
ncbi:Peroxisomal membrane protein PMP47A [Wickerhamiella sorbophila]|uniref:Peroxisomal membrane protein PMP47A n=1 Tax=Wickerhamiella sorbophila TaxID=45607 RepID=A0A2T0FJF5_9ASCO|nr:Peroxisomal membrane protein PMP47A [Wickerhamiella sorbophila]PRT55110.1 Peroxisomal membrane protein PMP47A [Wickerhamiella sorbophila]